MLCSIVGSREGEADVGSYDGESVGADVGSYDGESVGAAYDGESVHAADGAGDRGESG